MENDDVFKENGVSILTSKDKQDTKRKRVDTPEKEEVPKELQELREALTKLGQSSKILKGLIERNPYTKNEIKREITTIGRTKEVLTRKCFEWETYPTRVTHTNKENKKETVEKGCQTDPDKTKIKRRSIEEYESQEDKESIVKILEEGNKHVDSIAGIIDKNWPEDVFEMAVLDNGNPMQVDKKWDIALVIDPRNGDKGLLKGMGNKYPEILELIGQDMQEGQLEYIQNVTKTITSRKSTEEYTKYIYVLPQFIDEGGVNDIHVLYKMLLQLQEQACSKKTRKLLIATQDGIIREYARKLIEYVFRGKEVNIRYRSPENRKGLQNRGKSIQPQQRKSEESVLVKADGTTYVDLLKKIKSGVNIQTIGVGIKQLKKTAAGDLLLVVEGGPEKAETLRGEIRAKVQDVKVMDKRNNCGICIVTGIDGATSETEIIQELTVLTNLEGNKIKVRSLRTGRFGNQSAVIEMPSPEAKMLIKKGTIKLAWTSCRISERIEVTRCYRCLEFGHRAQECRGTDRKAECLKCGKEGHKAKECQNAPCCVTCKKEDHRADQMKCPHFRRIVEEKRKRRLSNGAAKDITNQLATRQGRP